MEQNEMWGLFTQSSQITIRDAYRTHFERLERRSWLAGSRSHSLSPVNMCGRSFWFMVARQPVLVMIVTVESSSIWESSEKRRTWMKSEVEVKKKARVVFHVSTCLMPYCICRFIIKEGRKDSLSALFLWSPTVEQSSEVMRRHKGQGEKQGVNEPFFWVRVTDKVRS